MEWIQISDKKAPVSINTIHDRVSPRYIMKKRKRSGSMRQSKNVLKINGPGKTHNFLLRDIVVIHSLTLFAIA